MAKGGERRDNEPWDKGASEGVRMQEVLHRWVKINR